MTFERLEDLKLWHRAMDLWRAVEDIVRRPGFRKDCTFRDQLSDAAGSLVSNIEEGFQQPTDRAFANFLYISKGSTAETRGGLKRAMEQEFISREEFRARDAIGDEVARMTVGLIKYLRKSDRRNRGLGSGNGNSSRAASPAVGARRRRPDRLG